MVRTLAVELAPAVRVNAVAPGVVAFPDQGYESDADMQARGYQHFLDAQRGQVGPAGVEFAVELEGNKCYALVALGDAGTRTLSIVRLGPIRSTHSSQANWPGCESGWAHSGPARPCLTRRVCAVSSNRPTPRWWLGHGPGRHLPPSLLAPAQQPPVDCGLRPRTAPIRGRSVIETTHRTSLNGPGTDDLGTSVRHGSFLHCLQSVALTQS
jgi:hypothetical protein